MTTSPVSKSSPLNSTRLEREFASAVYFEPHLLDGLRISPDEFSDPDAATVVRGQLACREAGEMVEPISVRLRVEASGGKYPETVDYTPDSVWTDRAWRALHGKAELRRTRAALKLALESCESGSVDGTRGHCEALGEARDASGEAGPVPLMEAGRRAAESALSAEATQRVNLGLPGVNNAVGGAGVGDMIVIGADTGVGKSSLALAMALGMEKHHVVGIVSCEDGEGVWGSRAAGSVTGVSSLRMVTGMARESTDDSRRLAAFVAKTPEKRIFIDFKIGRPTSDVLASIRRLARLGAKVIFVDYLQAILSETPSSPRKDQVRDIQVRLKGQTHALGVTLVLLSQLSRPAKGNENREPGKHDLKDCGDIENASEIILLLWPSPQGGVINLKVEKSKWGTRLKNHVLHRAKSGALVEGSDVDRDEPQQTFNDDPTADRYS